MVNRTLIRNASIVSMDDGIGTRSDCDLLIDGGRIAAIAPGIVADDAEIVDASGGILIPGLIDAHRHVWQSLIAGMWSYATAPTYFENIQLRLAASLTAEDVYFSQYVGGLAAIDSGVTQVVDHCNIGFTAAKSDAATLGLKDSGIAGIFCYQLSALPSYGPGQTVARKQAWKELFGPMDEFHLRDAERLRDAHFSDGAARLQFGLALSPSELVERRAEQICEEMRAARALGPKLVTQHLYGLRASVGYVPAKVAAIDALHEAGLLGPDYLVSHGNRLSPTELRKLADSGAALVATPVAEYNVGPPVHALARAHGVRAGIGSDTPVSLSPDYFEQVRAAHFGACSAVFAGVEPGHELTAFDALRFATIGAAEAMGTDAFTGSLSVGKYADIVLLACDRIGMPAANLDPVATVVYFAGIANVDSVWISGVRRKSNGRLLGTDVAKIRGELGERTAALAERAASIDLVD